MGSEIIRCCLYWTRPAALQGWLPGDPWVLAVRVARTKRSLKFLGRWKSINGRSENASRSRSKVWMVQRWHLVIEIKVGKIGWYVTTSSNAHFSLATDSFQLPATSIITELLREFELASLVLMTYIIRDLQLLFASPVSKEPFPQTEDCGTFLY